MFPNVCVNLSQNCSRGVIRNIYSFVANESLFALKSGNVIRLPSESENNKYDIMSGMSKLLGSIYVEYCSCIYIRVRISSSVVQSLFSLVIVLQEPLQLVLSGIMLKSTTVST